MSYDTERETEKEEYLVLSGTYKFIHGVQSFHHFKLVSKHQQYNGREVMVFGECHSCPGCPSSDDVAAVRSHVLLKYLIHTTKGEKIDVFVEVPHFHLRKSDDRDWNSIDSILAMDVKKYENKARFHWGDVRNRTAGFLDILVRSKQFINADVDQHKIRQYLKLQIEPLANEKNNLVDALFEHLQINKQLRKINALIAGLIRSHFKQLIQRSAKHILTTKDWPVVLAKTKAEQPNSKYHSFLLATLNTMILDLTVPFTNMYILARLFKPYVKRAIVFVGNAHVQDFINFYNSLSRELPSIGTVTMTSNTRSPSGSNCLRVDEPIQF